MLVDNLPQRMRRKHPYQYDKILETDYEFYRVDLNIDRPEMRKKDGKEVFCFHTDFSACSIWNGVKDFIFDNFTSIRRRFS